MTSASAGWQQQSGATGACSGPRGSKRALEIVGIVFLFFWFWPLAAAFIAWKLTGYAGLDDLRRLAERGGESVRGYRFGGAGFGGNPFAAGPFTSPFGGTGNAAFDEYRRQEIERLEQERRRLDEEAREFRTFVDELKRAKDREEFDAYMAKRRASGTQTA
ncbi:DUF2852 domain-containing protein [Enterovirga sp.]|jgi:hypothetical protein|uniref:DUF2852 domain-containing protein n=1 Tax=Enterovirga sp. TaxID=2026350 RepID=UPI00262910F0|nr:DUF2852 domain-containing protein [Enterovirga sp.]MDB5591825.1 hypothetical protein [Enterovirga sp.]